MRMLYRSVADTWYRRTLSIRFCYRIEVMLNYSKKSDKNRNMVFFHIFATVKKITIRLKIQWKIVRFQLRWNNPVSVKRGSRGRLFSAAPHANESTRIHLCKRIVSAPICTLPKALFSNTTFAHRREFLWSPQRGCIDSSENRQLPAVMETSHWESILCFHQRCKPEGSSSSPKRLTVLRVDFFATVSNTYDRQWSRLFYW